MTPLLQIVKNGEDAMIKCLSSTTPKWSHNEDYLPPNVRYSTEQSITIVQAEVSNKGYYECAGTTESGENFFSEALLKVRG